MDESPQTPQRLRFKDALRVTRAAVRETVSADLPGTSKRKGVALLMVLVTVAILAALSTEFAYNTRTNIWMSGNIRAQTQAHYNARSAMQIAMLAVNARKNFPQVNQVLSLIGKGKNAARLELWRRACDFVNIFCTGKAEFFGMTLLDFTDEEAVGVKNGACSCQVEAEDGRINLNAAAAGEGEVDTSNPLGAAGGRAPGANRRTSLRKERGRNDMGIQLYGLMRPFVDDGLLKDEQELTDIILNVMDWTDADDNKSDLGPDGKFTSGTGAEAADYSQYGYDAKNAKMDTVGELQLVDGMTSEMYCRMRDKLTVFSTDKINVNDADILLLKGLVCQALPEDQQLRYCWNFGLPSAVDEVLYNIETCRQLKKSVFSTPFTSPKRFTDMLKAVPNVLGIPPLPLNEAELRKQIGTRTKMVRVTAEGKFCWDEECRGICSDDNKRKCTDDSECGGGSCFKREVHRKLVAIIDTSSGSLVHFHTE